MTPTPTFDGWPSVESRNPEVDDGPMRVVALAAALLHVVVACAGCALWKEFTPTILWRGTDEEIQAAARKAAHTDIAAGRLRVAITGGEDTRPIGIPEEAWPLIRDLPTVDLPYGCTHPLLREAMLYAEAYNEVMYPYLVKREAERKQQRERGGAR